MSRALILVDIQNDFLPGGALAVPNGDEVISVTNRMIPDFDLVVATQDWHPATHESFASRHPGRRVGEAVDLHGLTQILWPDHCVRNSPGAEFAASLALPANAHVVRKGTDPTIDSYSGFFDNGHRQATGLADFLHERAVQDVFILGLATDYCVRFTALDAVELGFNTTLVEDGCRGVDLNSGDVRKAIEEMRAAGVHIVRSQTVRP